MIDFNYETIQYTVLAEAMRIADYATVCAGVLAVTETSEYPDATKQAIGRLGERMAGFNGGNPDAGAILNTIATTTWEEHGVTGVSALTTEDRAVIIGVIMAVSKSIISAESSRLTGLADTETTLPEGWGE